MVINNKYMLAQEVYLKADHDQKKAFVTAILVGGDGGVRYEISGCNRWVYDFELSDERNTVTATTN